jgi:hypothetical protein
MTKQQLALAAKIEKHILIVRGQRVMLDSDLADLYGVTTKVLNQAVKRNLDRFPSDFSYLLTLEEDKILRSQIVTSKSGGRRYQSRVFTEQGVAMLSSVLNSPLAIKVNIEIMRVFVQLRRLLATPGEIVEQLQKLSETVQLHDHQIKKIADVLRQMMTVPDPPPREMGFHTLRKKSGGTP